MLDGCKFKLLYPLIYKHNTLYSKPIYQNVHYNIYLMLGDKRMKIIGHQCHFQNQKEMNGMFRLFMQFILKKGGVSSLTSNWYFTLICCSIFYQNCFQFYAFFQNVYIYINKSKSYQSCLKERESFRYCTFDSIFVHTITRSFLWYCNLRYNRTFTCIWKNAKVRS